MGYDHNNKSNHVKPKVKILNAYLKDDSSNNNFKCTTKQVNFVVYKETKSKQPGLNESTYSKELDLRPKDVSCKSNQEQETSESYKDVNQVFQRSIQEKQENKTISNNRKGPTSVQHTTATKDIVSSGRVLLGNDIFNFWAMKQSIDTENGRNLKCTPKRQLSDETQMHKSVKKATHGKMSDTCLHQLSFHSETNTSNCIGMALSENKISSSTTEHRRKSKKDLISDFSIFDRVDNRVLSISKKIKSEGEWTIQNLVHCITEGAQNDLESIRAIWIWLCYNIEYDIHGFLGLSEKIYTPECVLQYGKGVCAGYSNLCQEMCKEVGIPCIEVCGYGKGIGYKLGQSYKHKKTNHTWNAVQLEDQWYLLDACWGAGTVDVERRTFIQQYDEFYFLPDPEEFIESHWPEDSKWQLLKDNVSLEEFERRVFKTSEFFKLGLTSHFPQDSFIQTENGEATVSVGCTYPVEFSYKLLDVCEANTKEMDLSYGIMTVSTQGMKLKIFPPQPGLTDLMIFVRPQGSQDNSKWVCSYNIKCTEQNNSETFPENPFHYWGLHQNAKSYGIDRCSHNEGTILFKTGKGEFILHNSRQLVATFELFHKDMDSSKSRRCLACCIEDDKITCHILCPLHGYYRLSVFVKDQGEKMFKNAGNFLIKCTNPVNLNELFPQNLSMYCGPGIRTNEVGLFGPSHSHPIINTKQGRCNVTFNSTRDTEVAATLTKSQLKNITYPLERYVFITHMEKKVTISFCLPEAGVYRLSIFARTTDVFSHVCDYVVRCFCDICWLPFPKVYGIWKKGYVLLEPRSGVIEENSWMKFRIRIPGAKKVFLIGESRTELCITKTGVWEGNVFTGPAGSKLKLAKKSTEQSTSMDVIMFFNVESSFVNTQICSG
ncbi:kyphoscoliosis peptidase-like [Protopterus annectens]|uniref:kyphoscoliosis peptidase-like n=1 Tax=Protopterus annectens TaxID=7888 RepID=UPI001CFA29D8|nr:kyphoscoliosis peptidase-like [Protopterus annectens]